MNDWLERLYAVKAEELAAAMQRDSFDAVLQRAHARRGSRRPFVATLRAAQRVGMIAEVKRASPSRGVIVERFDAAAVGASYEAAGVDAISVLTESSGFGGELADLDRVRAVTTRPLLRKDFLTTPYEVVQSAAAGADAVLLIVAGLDDQQLATLLAQAHEVALDALVEVHDEAELRRALAVGASCIGVNTRNLRSFSVDLALGERLLPLLPPTVFRVGESGIHTPEDARRLIDAGAQALLVGESLMRSGDRSGAVAGLRSA